MTNHGVKLEAKALAAAEAAYSRTCGGITEGRPMENAITAYCQTLAALPAAGATEPVAERECSACGGVGYYLHGPAGDVECPRCKGTGKMSELPSGGEPEPVAWRWRYDDPVSPSVRLGWFFGPVEPPPDAIGRSWSGWECEPLFASPPKPSEAITDEALIELAGATYDKVLTGELPDLNPFAAVVREIRAALAANLLAEAAQALTRIAGERDEALSHVEVLQAKIDPDEHCACGYDAGTDVCLHHSPIVHALEARAQAAEVERDRLRTALITIRDSFAPDSIVGARPDLGFHGFKGFKVVAREALGETK